jgi:hypothetical protein
MNEYGQFITGLFFIFVFFKLTMIELMIKEIKENIND